VITASTRLCRGCTGYLYRHDGRWVHLDGHGAIWHRCSCGWSGSEASRLRGVASACPECFSFNLVADHAAVPEMAR
jgi:hypothetical protein